MKDKIILLLCAAALAHSFELHERARTCNCDPSEAEKICEANFGNDNVIISHEYCNKFYQCSNGKPVALRCPANLLYNPLIEDCDWPANVDCGDRPISEDQDDDAGSDEDSGGDEGDNVGTCNCDPSEAPSICSADGSDGVLVAHEKCNQYYMCASGRPVAFSCGPTLLYNPYTEQCDWSQNVECGDRVIPEPDNDAENDSGNDDDDENDSDGTCNCNPEEAPIICAAPDSGGVLVAHENCNQYYICDNGRPIAANCSGNLLFNPYTNACDWPRNVECGERYLPEFECTSCNESGEGDESPPCDDDDGNDSADIDDVPPPGDDADNDSADIDDVPPPGDDDDNDSADIDDVPPPGDDADNDSADIDDVPPPGDDTDNDSADIDDVPPPGDDADNDSADIDDLPPPGDDADNDSADIDDLPPPGDDAGNDSADIDDLPPPGDDAGNNGTCNCNPEEAASICADKNSSGILVAHENCNQFYICDHNEPITLTCPDNLLYNPYTEKCDWPENVDCGDRIIPDPEDDGADNDSGDIDLPPGDNDSGNDSGNVELPPGDNDSSDVELPPGGDDSGNDNDGNCNCNPEEAPSICASEDSDGVLIAHENCNQFYKCDHGKPVTLICPGNLLYDPIKEICDWPENVDCGNRVIPDPEDDSDNDGGSNDGDDNDNGGNDSGDVELPPGGDDSGNDNDGNCNCNPEEAPSICASEESDGVLIAHENCNQFYMCSQGKPVTLTCPGNLLYDPIKEICDWPENVDCGNRVIPDPEDDSDNDGGGNDGGDNDNGGNDSGDVELPPGGDDSGNDNDGNCNCNPEEAPSICASEDSDGVLIAHENCNQFYKCDHGKPVTLICPGNLLYDPIKEICDWPENVDCGNRVIPDPEDDSDNDGGGNDGDDNDNGGNDSGDVELPPGGDDSGNDNDGNCNCNPEEAPSICASEESDGVLIAHENCNQFYMCSQGKPVTLTCPGNLLYDPVKEICDWPENVDCGNRVIPDPEDDSDNDGGSNDGDDNDNGGNDSGGVELPPGGDDSGNDNDGNCNCNPEEAPSICASEESDGVLIAHENCNQFYMCSQGKPVTLTCPGNLLYDPVKEICDWPENVDCGNRVIPDPEDDSDNDSGGNDNDDNDNDGNDNDGNDSGDNDNDSDNIGAGNCDPSEAPAICAAEDSDNILVAHENCNQYYVCTHGKPVALKCPGNLLFNPNTDRCDWPENVDCGDRTIPDSEGDSHENDSGDIDLPPGGDDSGNDDGKDPDDNLGNDSDGNDDNNDPDDNLGNDSDGNDDGNDPDDNLGNDSDGNDDGNDPDDSDCNDNGEECHCKPDEAPSICADNNSDGVLIAHEYCNHFYKCANYKPVAIKCPSNLLYNPLLEICDWPFNVDCGDRVIPESEEDNDASESEEVDDSDSDDDNVGTCNCNPEEAPAICAVGGSNGVLIAHKNCNQFYQCSFGKPVAMTCPPNLLYNPYIERCDWPANVECGDRVIPEPDEDNDSNDSEDDNDDNDTGNNVVHDDPSQAPSICANSSSEGVLVAHENCTQFYVCAGGSPVALTCSGELLFNPLNGQCDWPSNVECGNRIIPGDNDCACNFRNAPALCGRPDSNGKLIAHENCNQFYVCADTVPVARDCPANLYYNVDKEVCDWPQNVKCDGRMLPFASLNKHLKSRQNLRE